MEFENAIGLISFSLTLTASLASRLLFPHFLRTYHGHTRLGLGRQELRLFKEMKSGAAYFQRKWGSDIRSRRADDYRRTGPARID